MTIKYHPIFQWLLSILLITFVISSFAQEQPVKQTEPQKEELITYKISEIPFPQRDLHLRSGFNITGQTSEKEKK